MVSVGAHRAGMKIRERAADGVTILDLEGA